MLTMPYPGFVPWAVVLRPLGALTKSSRGVSPLFFSNGTQYLLRTHAPGNAELQLGYELPRGLAELELSVPGLELSYLPNSKTHGRPEDRPTMSHQTVGWASARPIESLSSLEQNLSFLNKTPLPQSNLHQLISDLRPPTSDLP